MAVRETGQWEKVPEGLLLSDIVLFVGEQTQAEQNVLCWFVQPDDKLFLTKIFILVAQDSACY